MWSLKSDGAWGGHVSLSEAGEPEEFLPLLVKYLYQHVCLRQKTINKKKSSGAARNNTGSFLFFFFFPIKLETFLVESELVGTQIDQQD